MRRTLVQIDGQRKSALENVRERLVLAMVVVAFAFTALTVRLVDLTVFQAVDRHTQLTLAPTPVSPPRADIVDRNGVILATSVPAATLGARTSQILYPKKTAAAVAAILPGLSAAYVEDRLNMSSPYVRIKRHITPRQQYLLNAVGDPGLEFEQESKRIYPNGNLAAHAVGFVDADGNGQLGVEGFRDASLKSMVKDGKSLTLTLDVRVQHALEDELLRAVNSFDAVGAAGIVMDVYTGEILAISSLPDFNPGAVDHSPRSNQFNRATYGVYELGSVFKVFTVAAGLEMGLADLSSRYDARHPIRIAGYTIHDDHPENRWLTLPELLIHSSNIAAAELALEIGPERQQSFLAGLGLLEPTGLEIGEIGQPEFSSRWGQVQTVTISYGHGLAVTPLHVAQAAAAILNGGILNRATLVRDHENDDQPRGRRVVSPETSRKMRQLMRLVVTDGTGRKADVPGYRLGGKTGTAEKAKAGGYSRKANITTFLGAFPMDEPRYVVLAMLDEAKPTKATHGFAGAGWTAAPVVRNVVLRVAPLLGVEPGPWDVDMEPARLVMQASLER